ncbi:MAG: hypothetical protein Q8R28_05490, partial [Dehalococcoidia bacterium]|nr:hypothetical protein [Dehalococcoidia bacterium]
MPSYANPANHHDPKQTLWEATLEEVVPSQLDRIRGKDDRKMESVHVRTLPLVFVVSWKQAVVKFGKRIRMDELRRLNIMHGALALIHMPELVAYSDIRQKAPAIGFSDAAIQFQATAKYRIRGDLFDIEMPNDTKLKYSDLDSADLEQVNELLNMGSIKQAVYLSVIASFATSTRWLHKEVVEVCREEVESLRKWLVRRSN